MSEWKKVKLGELVLYRIEFPNLFQNFHCFHT